MTYVILAAMSLLSLKVFASKTPFWVYNGYRSALNHGIPSGWMGAWESIKYDDHNFENPHSGKTCIKVKYELKDSDNIHWAGMYWQSRPNNWGDKGKGYDLQGYKKMTFWARGEKGGEVLAEAGIGGITGETNDTDKAEIGPIVLDKDWKQYTIDLSATNLANINGVFFWSTNLESNQEGLTFFLSDIRYE
jgi:hypothetical protein